ncbi:MAG TPA: hypothetical protein VFH31_13610, partial [Pyrinomonadaceae bacterium]|nr:hypothetical protein [Pyrinomonadaceae bacterium]
MSTPIMKTSGQTPFETFLNKHDEEEWLGAVTTLLRSIHEVDKSATQMWFAFYPLRLFKALQEATNPEQLARQLLLQGQYYLKDQIDSSHTFFYGHRYWPQVKRAIADHAATWAQTNDSLADQILEVATRVANELKIDVTLLVGITAVGFMTVQQVGL